MENSKNKTNDYSKYLELYLENNELRISSFTTISEDIIGWNYNQLYKLPSKFIFNTKTSLYDQYDISSQSKLISENVETNFIVPLYINYEQLLDIRLRPILSKDALIARIKEIFSFIKENSIKILFIKKFNINISEQLSNYFHLIIGRNNDNLFILDPTNNVIFYNRDIIHYPWLGYTFTREYEGNIEKDNIDWNNDSFFESHYLVMDTYNNQDKSDLHGYNKITPTYNETELPEISRILTKSGEGLSKINWEKLILSNYNNCKPLKNDNISKYKEFDVLRMDSKTIHQNLIFDKKNKEELIELDKTNKLKPYLCESKKEIPILR